MHKLEKEGCNIDNIFVCPFVDYNYFKKAQSKGWKVDPRYLTKNHPDLKPNTGMIDEAIFTLGLKKGE